MRMQRTLYCSLVNVDQFSPAVLTRPSAIHACTAASELRGSRLHRGIHKHTVQGNTRHLLQGDIHLGTLSLTSLGSTHGYVQALTETQGERCIAIGEPPVPIHLTTPNSHLLWLPKCTCARPLVNATTEFLQGLGNDSGSSDDSW
jgi:hypothetical protein